MSSIIRLLTCFGDSGSKLILKKLGWWVVEGWAGGEKY